MKRIRMRCSFEAIMVPGDLEFKEFGAIQDGLI